MSIISVTINCTWILLYTIARWLQVPMFSYIHTALHHQTFATCGMQAYMFYFKRTITILRGRNSYAQSTSGLWCSTMVCVYSWRPLGRYNFKVCLTEGSSIFSSYQNLCQVCHTTDNYKYKLLLHTALYWHLCKKSFIFQHFLSKNFTLLMNLFSTARITFFNPCSFIWHLTCRLTLSETSCTFASKYTRLGLFPYAFVLALQRSPFKYQNFSGM